MRRPKCCTHPSCGGGECRKCPWNPQFAYCGVWFASPPGQVRRPAWIMWVMGLTGGLVLSVLASSGSRAIVFVVIVTAGLTFLFSRWLHDPQPKANLSPENPAEKLGANNEENQAK